MVSNTKIVYLFPMHSNHRTDWTPEKVNLLKKFIYSTTLSASQIAKEIGASSRMAVIGKCHRLGFLRPPKSVSHGGRTKGKPGARRPRDASQAHKNGHTAIKTPFPMTDEPLGKITYVEPSQAISILDIEYGQCREPLGKGPDGLEWFCGKKVIKDSSSFCPGHHAKNFVQPHYKSR